MLPHYVIQSPQWRALGGNAIKFLVELASEYDGGNNGDLSLTRKTALKRGWRSGETRDNAAEEAVASGFAILTRQGNKGACSLYAIAWQPIDDVGKGVMYPASRTAPKTWESRAPLPRNWAQVAR
jgi:hypothetical protein